MKQFFIITFVSFLMLSLLPFALAENEDYILHQGNFSYSYLEDGSICIAEYTGNDKKVSVPAQIDGKTVTQIGTLAFAEYETSNITSVTLPDTIVRIQASAFSNCT